MKLWRCLNCGMEFDRPQPRNRCVCGFHLQVRLFCDKPSCGHQLIGRYLEAAEERILCEDHLSEVLRVSIALEAQA